MNRIDELTDRLIDGILSDAEAIELEGLLAADPASQSRHLTSLRLELALRGLRTHFDIAGPTVAQIEADRLNRTTAAVMQQIAAPPMPAPRRLLSRTWMRAAVAMAVAACVLVAWLATRTPDPLTPPGDSQREFARLVSLLGTAELSGPEGIEEARPDSILAPGKTLRMIGEESVAIVQFRDGSRVEIHPESQVELAGETNDLDTVRLELAQGRITARANGHRLLATAGATEVVATRGEFTLWTAGAGGARVEATNGDVRVSRAKPEEPLVLEAGRAAFLRDVQTPVRLESRMQIDSVPKFRYDFAALDVGFTTSDELLMLSTKQWMRWKPGVSSPEIKLFPPKVFNDGQVCWVTPDRKAVAYSRVEDREERVVVRDLPSGEERGQVPVRVVEPRFLGVAPDASWVATAASQKPNHRIIRVWDVRTGRERFAYEASNGVACLAASPDGRMIAVGVADNSRESNNVILLLDPQTGERIAELPTRRKAVTAITFSADSRTLAAGFNGAIQIWNLEQRKLQRALEGFERGITRVVFHPTRKLLAAGTQDGQVWIWSTQSWERTQVLDTGTRGVRSIAFNPDGKTLATATNKAAVAIWEIADEPANVDGAEY